MRKIRYNKLSIQNFLSVGNDTIVIDFNNGLNLITGKNLDNPERKNAVGKSVLIDAYYYALFGKTIREIKKEFIVNTETKGKGLVSLEFDVETQEGTKSYTVTRQVKPSKVTLTQGDLDITRDSIDNTNKFIQDLIGSNPIISKSCDILSLSDNTPFMAKKPDEKRKFIEDIFSLEIYGKMLKDLKELIKENKGEVSIKSTRLEEINNSMKMLVDQKQAFEKQVQEKEEILLKRKEAFEQKIKDIQSEIDEIVVEDVSSIKENINKLNEALATLFQNISNENDKLIKLKVSLKQCDTQISAFDIGGIVECDKCKQNIPHSHIETLEKQKAEWIEKRNEYRPLIEDAVKSISVMEDRKQKILKAVMDLNGKEAQSVRNSDKITSLTKLISEVRDSLERVEDDFKDGLGSVQVFEDNITLSKKRFDTESEEFGELKKKAEDYDTCKFILGEEGIKSFAVKKLLGMLNAGIQKYITDLGMNMKCKFDEYFEEQITNHKGKEISYWNFSGGERRTVDLACAWAFKDMKRKISGISSNVEFCDEIFDSAFDERGLDLLIEVLKTRIDKYNMSIYAISHRKETLKHIDGEIVMLEKENGITRRVDSEDA